MNYVIQNGDTLWDLARRHGTTVEALAQANGIVNPGLIRAGMTLDIPGAPMQPTTGAMPRPRPPSVAAQADSAPLPRPRPGADAPSSPVSGDGSVDRQFTQPNGRTPPRANLDYSLPIAPEAPQQIAQPSLGSVVAGALTPVGAPRPAIGGPDGDPDAAAIYAQPGLTRGQSQQYDAERPLPGNGVGVPVERVTRGELPDVPPGNGVGVPVEPVTQAPLPDVIRRVGEDMWQGRQGDAFRRGPQGTAPRGEMDPTLANRAAVRDALRAFAGMTEDQLWALDRSQFDEVQWDAWRRAVSAAMMDPNLRRGAGPGV